MGETGGSKRGRLPTKSACVLVLGSGVIGMTTAYSLGKAGFSVTVLERNERAGEGTSAENGAQLSYGFADPISSPATLRRLPAIVAGRDAGIDVNIASILSQPIWAFRFLRNSMAARSRDNTSVLTRLALYSRDVMAELRDDTKIEFDFAEAGRLVVYEDEKALAAAQGSVANRNAQGCALRILDRTQCLALEPALENWQSPFAGGIYSASDEVGDAGKFCRELQEYCAQNLGVRFRFGFTAKAILKDSGNAVGVIGDGGETIASDLVVNCMGSGANALGGVGGQLAPILPLKGYSLTIAADENSPSLSIASAEHRVVFARIGDRLRIAGLAHVRGNDLTLDEEFVNEMRATAQQVFPGAGDYGQLMLSWCGLRPLTPDGLPRIGETKTRNLFINAGHGGLGWTLAAGSADLLLRAVTSGAPRRLSRSTDFAVFAGKDPATIAT